MTQVVFDPTVGGDGSAVTDDSNATTGLANGGFRTRLLPMFQQIINIANFIVTKAAAAATSAATATTGANTATAAMTSAGVRYNFDTTVTMAVPGDGLVRFNNATLASVTGIALDYHCADSGNPAVNAWLLAWAGSTNTTKGHIVVRKLGSPATYVVYAITGVTDNTSWVQVAVTYVGSNGALSNADQLVLQFHRAGDKGVDGAVTLATAQLLQNKSFEDGSTWFVDNADNTKKAKFEVSNITTGTTRTLTVQNADHTLAGLEIQQAWTKPQRPALSAESAPASNALTWDLTTDSIKRVNLNANLTTLTLTGTLANLAGYQFRLVVRYNGGSAITWGSSFKWAAGTAPTLTGTSGKLDIFTFEVATTDGTNYYLCEIGRTLNVG